MRCSRRCWRVRAGLASRGWRCGRSVARLAMFSVAPDRLTRPRSWCCLRQGWRSHETVGAPMNAATNLWLIRHAPVDGPRGVIHGPDAPADLGDAAGFAALKARLPTNALAVCSPARRTRETAERLGLVAAEQPAFREQDFGAWTGRRHDELERELGPAYREFWKL